MNKLKIKVIGYNIESIIKKSKYSEDEDLFEEISTKDIKVLNKHIEKAHNECIKNQEYNKNVDILAFPMLVIEIYQNNTVYDIYNISTTDSIDETLNYFEFIFSPKYFNIDKIFYTEKYNWGHGVYQNKLEIAGFQIFLK